jgi:cobalt/nickel transport system permease protein
VPVWTVSAKKVKKEISRAKMPQLGIYAALSFLLMMFNVPLIGGTTGHAVGGTLIAILMGPWAACISVSVALLVQALLFGDGGILAFGANCFNMAFVLPFVGYYIYKFVKERFNSKGGETAAIILGSYFGLVVASLCAAVEFGVQPLLFTDAAGQALYCPYGLAVSIPAMVIPHLAVAGPVEVLFTLLIVTYVKKVSPEMIGPVPAKKTGAVWGLILGLICLTPLGLLATGTAWGEWSREEISGLAGYTPQGMSDGLDYSAMLPDYSVSGLPEAAGYVVSAVLGVAILVIIFKLLGDRRSGSAAQAK